MSSFQAEKGPKMRDFDFGAFQLKITWSNPSSICRAFHITSPYVTLSFVNNPNSIFLEDDWTTSNSAWHANLSESSSKNLLNWSSDNMFALSLLLSTSSTFAMFFSLLFSLSFSCFLCYFPFTLVALALLFLYSSITLFNFSTSTLLT